MGVFPGSFPAVVNLERITSRSRGVVTLSMGVLRKLLEEVGVPELEQIRAENAEIRTTLQMTNKRLDDINTHLTDLSRRIDAVRERYPRTSSRPTNASTKPTSGLTPCMGMRFAGSTGPMTG